MTDLVVDTIRKHRHGRINDNINPIELYRIVEKGFQPSLAESIAKMIYLPFPEFLKYLPIRRATYYNYKRQNKRLSKIVSDYLFQLLSLIAYGHQVFQDEEIFREWLYASSHALSNQRPIDLVDSHFGINLVHEELDRIEYGIY